MYTNSICTNTHYHTRRGVGINTQSACLNHTPTQTLIRTRTHKHSHGFQLVSVVFTCRHHFVVWREASKVIRSRTNKKPGQAGE